MQLLATHLLGEELHAFTLSDFGGCAVWQQLFSLWLLKRRETALLCETTKCSGDCPDAPGGTEGTDARHQTETDSQKYTRLSLTHKNCFEMIAAMTQTKALQDV